MCTVSIKVNDDLLHMAWANMGYDVDMIEWMQQQMEAILIRKAMASEKATPVSQTEGQPIPDIVLSLLGASGSMDDETLDFVRRSSYRQNVLKALEDNVLMPKEIAERSSIKTNHVSKVLSELKSKELIELVNPEARKGRLYRLTDDGDEIVDYLE